MPALRIMIVEDDPVLSGLLGGLVTAEMRLVMLYCEIKLYPAFLVFR